MISAALKNSTSQAALYDLISQIIPHDVLEQEHIEDTLAWIKSGAPLFRIAKPDVPNKHLVCYFVLFDEKAQKILLVDRKKAALWLPSGGHVEVDEDPKETVRRECLEELGVQAEFWISDPFFLTVTLTVGLTAGHTDVSLWYVLKGHHNTLYEFDKDEFNNIKWFGFDEIPYEKSDPHIRRFIEKLHNQLGYAEGKYKHTTITSIL